MAKYIDADRLRAEIENLRRIQRAIGDSAINLSMRRFFEGTEDMCNRFLPLIDSLQQEQQMPDSTQLISEWEKEKAVLEQKDFRGDAERMAYNAFLDGFVKGLGYEGTK